ncbi:MAG: aldose 1-epimerase family protein [Pseudonocardiaceae bacterium]
MNTPILARTAPSGQQFALRHADQEVVVTEVGGGLRSYTAGGRAVLDGYGVDEMCTAGRGQILIPWPNRVDGGHYRFGGSELVLPLTEPEAGNAIHGLTRWANWEPVEHGRSTLRLRHVLHAQPGWPFVLACELVYTLDDDGLRVRTSATNTGAQPCPYATGAHPYLTVGTARIDQARLRLPARTRYRTDSRGIPTGREPADELDGLIGDQRIDTAFTDLVRDADGRVRVRLSALDGPTVTLWADEAYGWVQVFTGDGVPEPARRRAGLAVEPMTAAPNALRTGEGLLTLAPGLRHSAEWGLQPG